MGRQHPLSAIALLLASGCMPMMIAQMVFETDSSASITVSGSEAELDFLLDQLTGSPSAPCATQWLAAT